jgi:transposase
MRSIGLDVHREFCEVAVSDGGRARSAGRVASTPERLELFAQSLGPDDRVVLEATGNALAILRILERHVGEVVLAHPGRLRAISHAKVKADKVDARRLAELLAADLIPEVWVGDERTRMLRRRVSRRRGLVKQATAVKNAASAVLVRNLKRRPAVSDLFGRAGRAWLERVELPEDERETLDGCLRQLDFLAGELALVDKAIAKAALASEEIRRLMTIPGVDITTAATLVAVIGEAPRRQPVPELVEVPPEVPLELMKRLLVDAGRAPVGLDPQPGLPNSPLGDRKRLRRRLAHPALPTDGG